jgi:uncharacterized protein (TIGR00266 family)
MADIIDYSILGDDMQVVEVELDPMEGVRAEAGTLMFMEDGIDMQTGTGGGLFKGFKRMLTGDGFFITTFLNTSHVKRKIGFSAPYPGKIIPIDLGKAGGEFLCQKDSFLCAARGVDIDIAFTKKIGAGLFGGEGFILQRIRGEGMAFVQAGGAIISRQLKAGETLHTDTGCLVGFMPSVDYDIRFIGGFKNALFGGEGMFLVKLTGRGQVYLQSLPFSRLSDRIIAASRSGREESRGAAGFGGSIIGNILSGDRNF